MTVFLTNYVGSNQVARRQERIEMDEWAEKVLFWLEISSMKRKAGDRVVRLDSVLLEMNLNRALRLNLFVYITWKVCVLLY